MMSFLWAVLVGILAVYMLYRLCSRSRLQHIPGPPTLPIVGNIHQLDRHRIRNTLLKWAKVYGPVYKIRVASNDVLVVSGFEEIRSVLMGQESSGRPISYLWTEVGRRAGVLHFPDADPHWKLLRVLTQGHLKQFGSGLSRLERIVRDFSGDLIDQFDQSKGQAMDPRSAIQETTLKTIACIVTGEKLESGDALLEKLREHDLEHSRVTSPSTSTVLMDTFPWISLLPTEGSRRLKKTLETGAEVCDMLKERCVGISGTGGGLYELLMSYVQGNQDSPEMSDPAKPSILLPIQAEQTCLDLLFAGLTTTSKTFYMLLNVLAHHPRVQEKLQAELLRVMGSEQEPGLDDRQQLPYARAVLYEHLRCLTLTTVGVKRRTVTDYVIGGYHVPKDTEVFPFLWGLHHEEEFWEDPNSFNPERFIDHTGDLLPADHPRRRRLFPFGGGPRLCLGKQIAMARLFLWMTMVVQRFTITPADGNSKATIDPVHIPSSLNLLLPEPYKVIFHPRKTSSSSQSVA